MSLLYSIFQKKTPYKFSILVLFCALIFSSCNDKPSLIGLDVLPPSDRLNVEYSDTNIVSGSLYNLKHENTTNDNSITVGDLNDPIFGELSGGLITPFWWYNVSGSYFNYAVDSVVVSFRPKFNIGDIHSLFDAQVFMIDTLLSFSSNYYSDFPIANHIGSENLAPGQVVNLKDTLIKIRLKSDFGTELLTFIQDTTSSDTTSSFNARFLKKFKGLYFQFKRRSGLGAFATIDMTSAENSIDIYLSNKPDTFKSILTFTLLNYITDVYGRITYLFPRINVFSKDYSHAVFASQVNNPKESDTLMYVQSLGGIKSVISFPGLNNFLQNKKTISVYKAEFSLFVDSVPGYSTNYIKPASMNFAVLQSGDTLASYSSIYKVNFVNGNYDLSTNSYLFNVTQCIQDLIKNRRSDVRLVLFPENSTFEPWGVILKNNTVAHKNKLKITYSKF